MLSHTTSHRDLKANPHLVRESWMAYDNLIAKAFAVKTPAMSEAPSSTQLETLRALDVRSRSHTLPRPPSDILSPEDELEPVWDAVREFKAKQLAALPSKVKSLEGIELVAQEYDVPEVPKSDEKKLKRKARWVLVSNVSI